MHTERSTDQSLNWSTRRTGGVADAAALVLERANASRPIQGRAMLSAELRQAIGNLCVRAHAERMTVEQLIVQLKEGWGAIPELRRLPRGGEHEAELACVITQCILDFYGDHHHPASNPAGTDAPSVDGGGAQ